jgi:hypothetical protein
MQSLHIGSQAVRLPITLICFVCGRTYTQGDGRFCSSRCRAGFDAGLPPCRPARPPFDLHPGDDGFLIECANCRQRFESRGLRCCSAACESAYRQTLELASDPFCAPKRTCPECGAAIPNWRGGRRVSQATKFCSERCRKRTARDAKSAPATVVAQTPYLSAQTAKKCPQNGPPRGGVRRPSVAAGGRS